MSGTTSIRVLCQSPSCPHNHAPGVLLPYTAVTLLLCDTTGVHSYAFRCPGCGVQNSTELAPFLVERLLKSGCALRHWSLPIPSTPVAITTPMSLDDLIDLHFELEAIDHNQEDL